MTFELLRQLLADAGDGSVVRITTVVDTCGEAIELAVILGEETEPHPARVTTADDQHDLDIALHYLSGTVEL